MSVELTLLVLLAALIADWFWGEPDILWKRLPHPVALFGKAIGFFDRRWNRADESAQLRYRLGSVAVAIVVIGAIVAGKLLAVLFLQLGWIGLVLEAFVVFTLLAQKSLVDHVRAVADGLATGGIEGGRRAVALVVGRDPNLLDRPAVARAAVETLSENFSDGVVAPAFWYAVFGLPGIFAYKMINTADSMIGYKNETYRDFGRTAALTDDLANWVPARISAVLIAAGAFVTLGVPAAKNSLVIALSDAGLHRSPNAGWPESAMAGACGFALGGPRVYPGETVSQAFINGAGKRDMDASDIERAIGVFASACFVFMGLIGILAVIF